jgi:hypothetical protein
MQNIHLHIILSDPGSSNFKRLGNVVAATERITPQMLENTWRETEYRLDILRAMKGAHVEVVQQPAVFILQSIKLIELHVHTP